MADPSQPLLDPEVSALLENPPELLVRAAGTLLKVHSGVWEESILLTVGRPASYDAGIRGKPLGGFPPNPLTLGLTEGVRGSHRVAPMMP